MSILENTCIRDIEIYQTRRFLSPSGLSLSCAPSPSLSTECDGDLKFSIATELEQTDTQEIDQLSSGRGLHQTKVSC